MRKIPTNKTTEFQLSQIENYFAYLPDYFSHKNITFFQNNNNQIFAKNKRQSKKLIAI
jgi:hypothetical protein